jgi:hypothetical protein
MPSDESGIVRLLLQIAALTLRVKVQEREIQELKDLLATREAPRAQ